jgi:tetratricopeptide (TPR) repeat protein/CHAT domain-containing protein
MRQSQLPAAVRLGAKTRAAPAKRRPNARWHEFLSAYSTTAVHHFYGASWCQRRAGLLKPKLDLFERSVLEAAVTAVGENLARDSARVERLSGLDPAEWNRTVDMLQASVAVRPGAFSVAIARIARVLLATVPPTRAADHLARGIPDEPPGHLFVSSLDNWLRFELVRAATDAELRLSHPDSDELLRTRGTSLLVAMLEAVAELPDLQRLALSLGMWRQDQPEIVRESLRDLAAMLARQGAIESVATVFPTPPVGSDYDVALYLTRRSSRSIGAQNIAANRSAGRQKLLTQNPAFGPLLNILLPYRSTKASRSETAGDAELMAVLEEAAAKGSFRLFELAIEDECERFVPMLPSYASQRQVPDPLAEGDLDRLASADAGLLRHLRACTRCRLSVNQLAEFAERRVSVAPAQGAPADDSDALSPAVQAALIGLLEGEERSQLKTRVAEGLGAQVALDEGTVLALESWVSSRRGGKLPRAVRAAVERQAALHPNIAMILRDRSQLSGAQRREGQPAAMTLAISPTRGSGNVALVTGAGGVTGRIVSSGGRAHVELHGLPHDFAKRRLRLEFSSRNDYHELLDKHSHPPHLPVEAKEARDGSWTADLGEEAPWMRALFLGAVNVAMVEVPDAVDQTQRFEDLSRAARKHGALVDALAHSRQQLLLVRRTGDIEREARVLRRTGAIRQDLGQYDQAQADYALALFAAETTGTNGVASDALRGMGESWHAQGDARAAVERLERALELAEGVGPPRRIASVLVSMALVYLDLGRIEDAQDAARRAHSIFAKDDDQLGSAAALNAQALTLRAKAQYEPALALAEKAITTFDAGAKTNLKSGRLLGQLHCTTGRIYLGLGHYERALEAFSESLSLMYLVGYRRGEADAIHATGRVYHALALWKPAAGSYERALAIFEQLGDRRRERIAWGTLARLHRDRAEEVASPEREALLTEALGCAERAIELAKTLGDERGQAITLTIRGHIRRDLGDDSARADLENALELRSSARDRRGTVTTLTELGALELRAGNALVAVERYRTALEISTEVKDPRAEISLLHKLGNAYVVLGCADDASAAHEAAVERVERLRRSIKDPHLRHHLFARYAECYRDYAVAVHRTDPQRAFAIADGSRARLTLDTVDATAPAGDSTLDYQLNGETVARAATEALSPDCALLSYLLHEDRAILFVVRSSGVSSVELPQDSATIEHQVSAMHEALFSGWPTYPYGHELYETLVAPAEESLAGIRHILISPDGCLNELPFALLLTTAVDSAPEAGDSGRFEWEEMPLLLKRYAVGTLPSLGVLGALKRRQDARKDEFDSNLLVVSSPGPDPRLPQSLESGPEIASDDAPGFSEEVRRIARAVYPDFPDGPLPDQLSLGGIRLLLRGQATRQRLHSGPRRARYVHIAANSAESPNLIDGTSGADSPALWLSGGETWHQDEIVHNDLVSEVLTLNTDAGAAGPRHAAEGPLSLARAFLMSGSSSVCASLGPIAANTAAEFFEALYTELVKGAPAIEAVRTAQLALADRRYHGLHWGGFQLLGLP